MISSADVEFFQENGFILLPEIIPAIEMDRLKEITDQFVESSREVSGPSEIFEFEADHRPDRPRVQRIKTPHLHHPVYDAMLRHPVILSIVERLIGPGLRFQFGKVNLKIGDGGGGVQWHQDWAFHPHTNDSIVAVAVLMDDVLMDSGPLLVVPGSHRGPVYNHHQGGVFCGAIDLQAEGVDITKAQPIIGKSGSISIHHSRVLHGSAPNTSPRPRRLLINNYSARDAWPLLGVADLDHYNAQLLSGEPCLEPRLEAVPVRIPLPSASETGSIFEAQRSAKNSLFAADQP